MKQAKIESENRRMLPKDHRVTSPSTDEGSSGGSLPGGGMGGGSGSSLKKGPWTSAEDAILVEYVQKHGEGNWNAVQKHSGLSRCGKSCRLRWANHLRPNLKKGAFTPEEENLIIELHAKLGNKWARMAAHLPGRTDNEIKNYWNTRIKRRQRAGLPIYPSNMPFVDSSDSLHDPTVGDFASGDQMEIDGGISGNGYNIPTIQFENYNVCNAAPLTYSPAVPAYSFSDMLHQAGFESSQTHGYLLNPSPIDCKRPKMSDNLFPGYLGNELLAFDSRASYDPDPITMNLGFYDGGSHALINGNFSTSRTLPGTVKSELPSLQYTDVIDPNCWMAYPSSPPPEAVENYTQSPPTLSVQSECSSPHNSNSGLLEEVLHKSHVLFGGKSKQLSDKSSHSNSNSSAVTPNDMMDNSSANNFGWEDCDPNSPLGGSASSVFNACTPPVSGSSITELQPASRVSSGSDIDLPNMAEEDMRQKTKFLRPDALLGHANWFTRKEHKDMNSVVNSILTGEVGNEKKAVLSPEAGAMPNSGEIPGRPWDSLPNLCPIPGLR